MTRRFNVKNLHFSAPHYSRGHTVIFDSLTANSSVVCPRASRNSFPLQRFEERQHSTSNRPKTDQQNRGNRSSKQRSLCVTFARTTVRNSCPFYKLAHSSIEHDTYLKDEVRYPRKRDEIPGKVACLYLDLQI